MDKNIILAEFQGLMWPETKEEPYLYLKSYDWLMRVWFKFKELKFENPQDCIIHSEYKSEIGLSLITDKEILKPYLKLVEAVEWYNSTLK